MRIYLAGGMHSDWREIYYKHLWISNSFYLLNPMTHGLTDPQMYTEWDLRAIKSCDVFVGYIDKDNPSGYGLNLEIGYAKALGKKIVLVTDPNFLADPRHKYFLMAVCCADVRLDNHEKAIEFLRRLNNVY